MKEIELTQGKKAIVDDDVFEDVSKFKWFYNKQSNWAQRTLTRDGKKTTITLHRFIMNAPKGLQVDHINGNRLDNRKSNLRLCTTAENQRNKKKDKGDSSRYKGVHFYKTKRNKTGKYKAKIQINEKRIDLGYFYTEKQAAIAYNEAAIKYHGEFANLNKVDDEVDFTAYQELAGRTLPKNKHYKTNVSNFAMGIAGESGEIVDYIKKVIHHGHDFDVEHLEKELGDLLWYISAMATVNNLDLEDIATKNLEKLNARYPNGFSENDSVNRAD